MTDHEGAADGESGGRPSPWYVRALMAFSAITMAGMAVVTFSDVVGRYVFNSPIPGGFEYVEFILGLTIFSAFALVTRDQDHITVGLLDHLYQGRVRWVQQLVVMVIGAVMVGFIAARMWDQGETMREFDQLGEYLDFELWPIVHAFTFFCVVALLFQFRAIYRHLVNRRWDG